MKQHQDQLMESYNAIMGQRDAAILERNFALAEKKKAFNDRDRAILQRDAVICERNSVIAVRNIAIAQLHYKSRLMRDNNLVHVQEENHMNVLSDSAEAAYNPREVPFSDNYQNSTFESETPKSKKLKRSKDTKTVRSKKSPNPAKKSKRGRTKGLSKQHDSPAKNIIWKKEQDDSGDGFEFDDNSGVNQLNLVSNMRIGPVCSCTGKLQPCYKWGSGGWQSACCTTTLSMFPLPHRGDKPHQRIGGRKMSGGVYAKLLHRLVREGHDFSSPVDLKEHWARHGTNRYITIK